MNRLDIELVERGLCGSRVQASRAIMAGTVRVNQQVAQKSSQSVKPSDVIEVSVGERYVSRGGLKLEHALKEFALDVKNKIALDLGASTGGFTDCLLQHGAAKVYAVDVGRGQLAWKLRNDPRVVVMEQLNARSLTRSHFPAEFGAADLVVIDCSFISLTKIVPAAIPLLRSGGQIIPLIKPQFEAGKAEADKTRGVIKDPAIHQRVLSEIKEFVSAQPELRWKAVVQSPILGPAGNKEFLALIGKMI